MFEFDASRKLLEDENERKPNIYVARILQFGIMLMIFVLIANETISLRLNKVTLRICVTIDIIFSIIPQIIAYNESFVKNTKSKYVVMFCVCVATFIHSLTVLIFAVPFLLFPMLLSVKYNSTKMARFAIAGSALCAVVAPPLSCALGLLDGMLKIVRFSFNEVSPLNILLFISSPWLMTVLFLSNLSLTAAKKGEDNIQNQIQLLNISRHDALTGLYNQNMYKDFLSGNFPEESVGIMFFDVDGLKSTNDSRGHEFGDLLLKRCAESLEVLFDDNCHGFRIGGDEFLVVVDTDDAKVLEEKLRNWKDAIELINREYNNNLSELICHMSVGTAFGMKSDLSNLIAEADKKMYAEKEKHHREFHRL